MASEMAKAMMRNEALDRVTASAQEVSNKLGIDSFVPPLRAKDLTVREYQWYEAIASYLEKVADTLPELVSSDLPNDPNDQDVDNPSNDDGSDDLPTDDDFEKSDKQSADTSTDDESPTDDQSVDDEHTSAHLLDYSKMTKKDLIELYPELELSDSMTKQEIIKAVEDHAQPK